MIENKSVPFSLFDGLLRAEVFVARGRRAFCGAVRLIAAEPKSWESSAAWDYCVRGGFSTAVIAAKVEAYFGIKKILKDES